VALPPVPKWGLLGQALIGALAALMALPPQMVAQALDEAANRTTTAPRLQGQPADSASPSSAEAGVAEASPAGFTTSATSSAATGSRLALAREGKSDELSLRIHCGSEPALYTVQSSPDLANWQAVFSLRGAPGETLPVHTLPPSGQARFYRLIEQPWSGATTPADSGVTLAAEPPQALGDGSGIVPMGDPPEGQLLVVTDDSARVFVLRAHADGTFAPAQQIATGNGYTRGVVVGDFNRDGLADIVTGGANGDLLTPWLFAGRADGGFEPRVPLPTASGANSYMMDGAGGDFDCDGNLDAVFGGNNSYVFFYWGRGDGTFLLEVKNWGNYGRGMDTGDFDEDGRDDLVRAIYSDGNLRVYLSNGDRTFKDPIRLDRGGSDPYGVVVGDFDEDGHADILANNGGSGDVTFFKGRGDGTFSNEGVNGVRANLDVDNYAAMDAFDYDRDGHLDIGIATYTSQTVYYWAGRGDGTFGPDRITLASGLGGNALGIAAPPLPERVDVQITPRNPVAAVNTPLSLEAVGTGIAVGDTFRWTFGDETANPLAWSFDPGMPNLGPSVTHTYTEEGRVLARLWHTDNRGIQSCRGAWVSVRAEPPVAQPGGPYHLGESVASQGVWTANFDGSASSDDVAVESYAWDFGNGKTGTGPTVQTTYNAAGTYTLSLTVSDPSGQTHTATTTVEVGGDEIPVARISASTLRPEGTEPILFSAATSTDDHGIYTYRWWLPPPNRFDFAGQVLDSEQWATTGTQQDERLMVTGNGWGGAGFASSALRLARGMAFEGRVDTSTGYSHAMVGFRSLDNNDRSYQRLIHALYFADGALYIYEYGNHRGQVGSYERGRSYDFRVESKASAGARYLVRPSGTGQPFAQVYESSNYSDPVMGIGGDVHSGVFGFDEFALFAPSVEFRTPVFPGGTVRLEVMDHALQVNEASVDVTPIVGAPPQAVITGPAVAEETFARNGVWTVTFDGTASTDDRGIVKWDWDFGGGKKGSGSTVQTTYNAAGTYAVGLTVTDYAGQTHSASHSVVVHGNGLPTPVISGPDTLDQTVANNGLWSGTWNGLASSDDTGIYRYNWNFGDGGATASGATVTHKYAAAGAYDLTLTAYDHANQSASLTRTIAVVGGELPVARITVSNSAPEGDQPILLSGSSSTDDRGITAYHWLLPPQRFDFTGAQINPGEWTASSGVRQEGRLIVTGANNWGQTYFQSGRARIRRGGSFQGRIDVPTGTVHAMVGLWNSTTTSAHYDNLSHAFYFNSNDGGRVDVYEAGNHRGTVAPCTLGASYDFRIETKPEGGARYYLRPSGGGASFQFVYEGASPSDPVLGIGADVYAGIYGFDDFQIAGRTATGVETTISVGEGGVITLEVEDHERQTDTATVTVRRAVGKAPVPVVSAPSSGPAGVELSFNAYGSSDDHAIAGYSWDFGDGSPAGLGPIVAHRFDSAGAYRVILTVLDYAGQTATASALVAVSEGNSLAAVPWRILEGIELPHETIAGKSVRLKAVARGVPVPFEYTWDFGDGSDAVVQTVTHAAAHHNLEAIHAYNGVEGTPFHAVVRVTLPDGTILSDTYPILLQPRTLDAEMNVAIDEGLWWLHKTQTRYSINSTTHGAYWTYNRYSSFNNNVTASAVQAFGINGHHADGNAAADPYVETVRRGMNFLMEGLVGVAIWQRPYGNPDGNGNGIGVTCTKGGNWNYERVPYELGAVMDAFVAAATPDSVAGLGGSGVLGRPLRDIMQDMVDMYAWSQNDTGGWRYFFTSSDADNSVCQWAAIGFMAADRYWGVPIAEWVIQRNMAWLTNSCCFGYSGGGNGDATTPSGMVQLAANGVPTSHPLWRQAENAVANNWARLMSVNNLYANYAVVKALRLANPPVDQLSLTGVDWFRDSAKGLARVTVDRQRADGSWLGSGRGYDDDAPLSTAWSVIMLTPSVLQVGPVAVIHFRPNPSALGFPVTFDATASYHQHPSYQIVEYRWDFDASDGVDFDNPDEIGPIVSTSFGSLGTRTVTLQVRDNATPQHYATASVQAQTTVPPFPPTADAGGPYVAATGEDITLDGAGSFDIDESSGDYIQAWDWEVDFQMPLDYDDGVSGTDAVFAGGYASAGKRDISLRVTDATSIVFPSLGIPDQTGIDFATVQVYDRLIDDLQVRPKGEKVQLLWTKVGDFASIQRSTDGPNRGFVEIARTDSDYAVFIDNDVASDIEYYYRIFAYRSGSPDPIGVSDAKFGVTRPRNVKNWPPRFLDTPSRTAYVGEPYEPALRAVDPEGDPFQFRLLTGPYGFTVAPDLGRVQFLPAESQVGSHPISVEVANDAGRNVLSYTLVVSVRPNRPPTVNAHGPYSGLAGQPVAFSSQGTSDPNGHLLTYMWVFGDGIVSAEANPRHVYGAAGTYEVVLYVNDGHGGTDSKVTSATIVPANRPPFADAGSGQIRFVQDTVQLTGEMSMDLDGDPLTFVWNMASRPEASASEIVNPTSPNPTFVPDVAGIYVVQLVVSDGQADSLPDELLVLANPFSLVPNLIGRPEGAALTMLSDNDLMLGAILRQTSETVPAEEVFEQEPAAGTKVAIGSLVNIAVSAGPDTSSPTVQILVAPSEVLVGGVVALTVVAVDNAEVVNESLTVNGQALALVNHRAQFTCANVGPFLAVATATDAAGNVGTGQVQFIAVAPSGNQPPQWRSAPPVLAKAGIEYAYDPDVIDPEGDPLSWSLDSQPPGMAINASTGAIRWTPTSDQRGTHTVRIRVDDGKGAYATQTYTILVQVENESPQLTSTPPPFAEVGQLYTYPVAATDPDGDALAFSLSSAPAAMTINAVSGFIQWQPVAADLGPHTIVVRVDDGRGAIITQTYSLTVQTGNLPPAIISAPPTLAAADAPYAYALVARDPNGDPLSFTLAAGPATMTVNEASGLVQWVPSTADLGPHQVALVVEDGRGGSARQGYTLTVETGNLAPDITSTPDPVAYAHQRYTYAVEATDPNGDTLSFSLDTHPDGMVIDPATGEVDWTPATTQVGTHVVVIRVDDGHHAAATQTFDIAVAREPDADDQYPEITSTPPFVGFVGTLYRYQIIAHDPDGDSLEYRLLAGPAGLQLNSITGLVQWTPAAGQGGNHTISLAVFDPQGAGVSQTFVVQVRLPNQPPTITSTPALSVSAGAVYRYALNVSDPERDPLTFALAGPAGMAIDPLGRVTWPTTSTDIGIKHITITATDAWGASATQQFDLAVTADTTRPQVAIVHPTDPLLVGTVLDVTVVATDDVGVTSVSLTFAGNPVALDGNRHATIPLTRTGSFTLVAQATDAAGNVGQASYQQLVFSTVEDTTPPEVALTAPDEDAVIGAPVDIVGTARDENLVRYSLLVAPLGTSDFREVFRGDVSVEDGVLGKLDPSGLANDSYTLRLEAQDAAGFITSVDRTLHVAGDLKLGNFTLSFVDLSIPVSGIPITVGRTYNSLNASERGDFGYGWRLEFREVNLRNNLPPRSDFDLEFGLYPAFTDRTRVYVTLPGGRRQGFTFRPVPMGGFTSFLGFMKPAFEPDPGVTSALTVEAGPGVVLRYVDGLGEYQAVVAGGGTVEYNPEDPVFGGGYNLTTKEGIAYRIDGATHQVSRVIDANANTITFTDTAITSSAGPRVLLERDGQGRIRAITDPSGLTLAYAYDANGDLVSVADREGNVTQFSYHPSRPHYLEKIIDPLGRTGVRSEYDEQGRLVALVDAAGQPVQLVHDPDNWTEQVVDALGNTTTFVYDERGNVIQEINPLGGVTQREYDLGNNMTLEVDPLGNANRFTYDADGNVLTRIDPLGNVTLNTYSRIYPRGWFNFTGRTITLLATTTDPLGNTTQNAYDTAGNLTATTDALGNVTRYEYDGAGNQTKITDAAGNVTLFAYDPAGRLIEQTDALGNVTTFTYDANGNQLTQATTLTTPSGPKLLVTTTTYDANGHPTSVTDAAGNVTRTEYDALGKTKATIDGLGYRTEFEYDERGQLVRTTFPDDAFALLAYDPAGRRTASTDRAGRTTHYLYDALGRLVATTYPDDTPGDPGDNPQTLTYHDDAGRVIVHTDERGNSTWFGYDAAGRQTSVTNALGHVTRSEYDSAGRKTADLDALGRATRFQYDALGRRVKTIFADNTTKQTAYDALGRVTSETDQAGVKTQFEYDALGRLTAVVDALGGRTEYGYNEQGQLVRQRDANGHVTRYEYETCCQRSATVLPLGQRSTTIYNEVNNVKSVTDFNGRTILFQYDVNNRLKAKRFPDGTSIEFGYTPTGRRQRITDLRGVTAFEYDVRDRLLKRTDPDGRFVAYTYDAAGNRTAVITATGTTSYGFDELNRLATVTDTEGDVTRYTYDLANNVQRMELPNGTVRVNTYDALNRVNNIEHSGPAGIFASFRYTMGPTGNRTEVREHDGRVVSYTYDALYRLVREAINDPTVGNRTISYAMDPVGNRLTRDDSAEGVTMYAYDPNDQLLTEALAGITTSYSYDANGNTLSRSNANASAEYEWDAENHLVGARIRSPLSAQPTTLNLIYDSDGIRVSKTVSEADNTETTTYLIDANRPYAQVLEEWPSLNAQPATLNASYTYGLHQPISQLRNSERSYYHADHLGSTRALTGQPGSPNDRYAFDAYGRSLRQTGPTANDYLFAGEQRDKQLGLDYLRARYLNVGTGRLYGRDTFQGFERLPISQHSFLYAHANAVNNIDPSGNVTLIELMADLQIQAVLRTIQTVKYGGYVCKANTAVQGYDTAIFLSQLAITISAALLEERASGQFALDFRPDSKVSVLKSFGVRAVAKPNGLSAEIVVETTAGKLVYIYPDNQFKYGIDKSLIKTRICGVPLDADLLVRQKPTTSSLTTTFGIQVTIGNYFKIQTQLLGFQSYPSPGFFLP
jgi:RHS repeat-associated protein